MNGHLAVFALATAAMVFSVSAARAGDDQGTPESAYVYVDAGKVYVLHGRQFLEAKLTTTEVPVKDHEAKAAQIRLHSAKSATDTDGTRALTAGESRLAVDLYRKLGTIASAAELWQTTEDTPGARKYRLVRTVFATFSPGVAYGPPYGYLHERRAYVLSKGAFVEGKLNVTTEAAVDHRGARGQIRSYAGRFATDPDGASTMGPAEAGLVATLFVELGAIQHGCEFWQRSPDGTWKFLRPLEAVQKDGKVAYGYLEDGKAYVLHEGVFRETTLDR